MGLSRGSVCVKQRRTVSGESDQEVGIRLTTVTAIVITIIIIIIIIIMTMYSYCMFMSDYPD